MTSEPETNKLSPLWNCSRFVIIAALAFMVTWLGVSVQERFSGPKTPPASAARNSVAPRGRKALVPAEFGGWDENHCRVVARSIVKEGIPVPVEGKVVYHLRKSGVWGKGFQGFFESPYSPDQVRGFYLEYLPQAGWNMDTSFTRAAKQVRGATSLRFTRGPATVMVNLFKNKDDDQATDFRLSITRR